MRGSVPYRPFSFLFFFGSALSISPTSQSLIRAFVAWSTYVEPWLLQRCVNADHTGEVVSASFHSRLLLSARIELSDSFCQFVESLFPVEIQVRPETEPFVLLHVEFNMLTGGPCASSGHSQSPRIDMSTSLLLVLQERFSSLVLQVKISGGQRASSCFFFL